MITDNDAYQELVPCGAVTSFETGKVIKGKGSRKGGMVPQEREAKCNRPRGHEGPHKVTDHDARVLRQWDA